MRTAITIHNALLIGVYDDDPQQKRSAATITMTVSVKFVGPDLFPTRNQVQIISGSSPPMYCKSKVPEEE
jgi:hypothetical protein